MKEEKKVFNCDRCGVECHYDKEYPYNLCYRCDNEVSQEIINSLKWEIVELKAESDKLKEKNRAIKQIAETVGRIGDSETALENYSVSQQNRILMFSNQNLCQQLAEKDKEIELLTKKLKDTEQERLENRTDYLTWKNRAILFENQLKANTKWVCEKIREEYNLSGKSIVDEFGDTSFGYVMIDAKRLSEFLDQIEKGE